MFNTTHILYALCFLGTYGWIIDSILAQPALRVRPSGPQTVEIKWFGSATPMELQVSRSLGVGAVWIPADPIPTLVGDEYSVTIAAGGVTRFYRLGVQGLSTLAGSSPEDNEIDVAVTRETVFRLTAPLSVDATLSPTNFYATAAGRRLLTRAELSSDRRTATLFYLEPLPGSARVEAVLEGAGLKDSFGRALDLDADGSAGGNATVGFQTLNLAPLAGTAVIGRVFASETVPSAAAGATAVNRPLQGVTISVDGREESLRTQTDAQGNFKLEPVPPGRFFVHIDGRTAIGSRWPDGDYYPTVGKQWEAAPLRTDNRAGETGEIFLPLVKQGSLQPVSQTADTTITFVADVIQQNPALAGVKITVPANGLFSESGTRGGRVGIAPVPPDRLPSRLPPGLEMPIVITVQTDGPLNFDKPAPVCFPNLPDPITKQPLPPGSRQALISFNHDKGKWEAVGSMTVSADGKLVCTDPGSGVLQPGWHGVGPPPGGPPPPPCPDGGPDGGGPEPEALPRRGARAALAATSDLSLQHGGVGVAPAKTEAQCIADCEKAGAACRAGVERLAAQRLQACFNLQAQSGVTCNAQAINDVLSLDLKECAEAEKACKEKCKKPPPKKPKRRPPACRPSPNSPEEASVSLARTSLAVGASSAEAVVEQIHELFQQMLATTAPFQGQPGPLPNEVKTQVDELWAALNFLGGGDVAAYLENHALQAELRAVATDTLEEPEGDAPDYPVLYMATILRPGGEMILRGQTDPWGQYQLFVPRDGKIASVRFYDPQTKSVGLVFPRLRADPPWRLPSFTLYSVEGMTDSDNDGLPDVVEAIYGTDPRNRDSDGDGLGDAAEIEGGTNPLDGRPTQTGVIATVSTPGPAVSLDIANDLAIVAEQEQGISVFNVFNGLNPVLMAQVDTPGVASRVAVAGNWVAVADGSAGLALIDISNPSQPRLTQEVRLSGVAQSVALSLDTAYVGLSSGEIAAVDVSTGTVLGSVTLGSAIWDTALQGNYLYALSADRLFATEIVNRLPVRRDSAPAPLVLGPNQRLFVGAETAYSVHSKGYNTLSLTNPAAPVLIKAGDTTQFGWRRLVSTGGGLGLAAVGINSTDDGPHDVSLYDLSNPAETDRFVTTFPTPGHADDVVVYNGLAYVADREAGLQVVNYLAFDSKRISPTVRLTVSTNRVQEQSQTGLWAVASAQDDVQVRNVELYADGVRVATDGAYPFEFRFVAPSILGTNVVQLRAKVTDTGGNSAWSDPVPLELLPKPPAVVRVFPRSAIVDVSTITVFFDEPIAAASLSASTLQLFAAGPDGALGTADDTMITGGVVALSAKADSATMSFGSPLPIGAYRVVIRSDIADLNGNRMGHDALSDFRVVQAVYWSGSEGGEWTDAKNWNTGQVPGPADDVVIARVDRITVRHAGAATVVKSLTSDVPMLLAEGDLEVLGAFQVNDLLEISGGSLTRTRLTKGDTAQAAVRVRPRSTVRLDAVTIDADLVIQDSSRLDVVNGLTVNGSVILASSGGGAELQFRGTQSLQGNGQVVFAGTRENNLVSVFNGTLTLGAVITIRGSSGFVGNASQPVVNEGTILADVGGGQIVVAGDRLTNRGTMEVRAGSVLALDGNWANEGIVRVDGGELSLRGVGTTAGLGRIERVGGVIKIAGILDNRGENFRLNADTGSWQLTGTLRNGHASWGAGAVLETQPYSTLDGVSLDSDLTLADGNTLLVVNGLAVNKVLTLASAGKPTELQLRGTQTLGGTGQIVFGGTRENNYITVFNGNMTIGPTLTIRGGSGAIGNVSLPVINEGTILASTVGSQILLGGGPLTNRGTIDAQGGAVVALDGNWSNEGTLGVHGGELSLRGSFTTLGLGRIDRVGGTVKLVGTLDNTGASFKLDAATGSWQLAGTIRGGSLQWQGGAVLETLPFSAWDGATLESDFTLSDGNTLILANGLTINRTLTLASGGKPTELQLRGTQTIGGTGEIVFGGSSPNNYLTVFNGSMTIGKGFTIRGGAGALGNPSLPVTNQGTIQAESAGSSIVIRANPFTDEGVIKEDDGGRVLINP